MVALFYINEYSRNDSDIIVFSHKVTGFLLANIQKGIGLLHIIS